MIFAVEWVRVLLDAAERLAPTLVVISYPHFSIRAASARYDCCSNTVSLPSGSKAEILMLKDSDERMYWNSPT